MTPDMDSHDHEFPDSEWPFSDPINAAALTTTRVAREGYPVLLVTHDAEGDWQILCGTTNDTKDALIVCLGCAYQRDKTIGTLADLPLGWRAWRESTNDPWIREEKEPEPDED